MSTVNLGLMENRLSEQEAKRDIETENIKVLLKFVPFAVVAVAILILVGVSNFKLFHFLSELFAVFIAFFTFFTALLIFKISRNNFIMYLGCGYFWVGMLDLAHVLFFKNMGIISGGGANISVQFWILGRYLEGFLLLTSFYFLKRKVNTWLVFTGFGLFSIIFYSLITAGIFPDCFVEGRGLTAFKKASEYVIIGILFLTLLRQKYVKHLLEENVYINIFLAITITIISETLFTLYSNVFDGYVIAGHITKIFSFLFIFLAVIPGTIREPHEKYRQILESAHDSIFFTDPETLKFIDVNKNAAFRLGYTKKELLGLTPLDISSPASEVDVLNIAKKSNPGNPLPLNTSTRRKTEPAFQ